VTAGAWPHEAVVTGLGIVSPIGADPEEFWESLVSGRTGVGPVLSFDTTGYPSGIGAEIAEFVTPGAQVDERPVGRAAQLAAAAGRQALLDARIEGADARTTALCVGTTMGESCWIEAWPREGVAAGPSAVPAEELLRSAPEQVGADAAALLDLTGGVTVLGGACAAGNYALGQAADLVRSGRAERVLAGGVDAFSRVAFTGFARLGALASEACRPFSRDREGIVLGEGAAMMLVESRESAAARGVAPLATIAGFGLSSDAFHIVSPDPEGKGAARAMRAALADADLSPDAIDYVSAHGTGTDANDRAEVTAARAVFGEGVVPMSSIKALTGHALGAASAFEAVACILALREQTAPPTWNFREPDPECEWDVVPNEARPVPIAAAMSNAYAFGGSNASLILVHSEP
jgi:3-oxoacyl-[acyl-carrier-protein] synthase II